VRLVCLEVIVVVVKFDKEAVGENGHARDNAKDCVSDGLLDQKTVGDVGSIREVKLEAWRVDERDLCGSNLYLVLVGCSVVCRGTAPTNGMMFVRGQSKIDSLPIR
jgi:hypothetical protein